MSNNHVNVGFTRMSNNSFTKFETDNKLTVTNTSDKVNTNTQKDVENMVMIVSCLTSATL